MKSRKTEPPVGAPRPRRSTGRSRPAAGLSEYRRKRDFVRTPEPAGATGPQAARPLLYVIQRHRASHLHFDLRLQYGSVLKSWAIPKTPPEKTGEKRLAVETEDHPLDYAGFEGTIPEGQYGAGTVEVWDRGTYEPLDWQASKVVIDIRGRRLKGAHALVRLRPKEGEKAKNWLFFKLKDDGTQSGRKGKS